jgi:hypothetical protein
MRKVSSLAAVIALALWVGVPALASQGDNSQHIAFHTSDRCLACHHGSAMPGDKQVTIATDWRASVMANSARDPYWQASVRRETIDHPELSGAIQDECSTCHAPIPRYEAKLEHREFEILPLLPFTQNKDEATAQAEDGVSCSVCHQISKEKLGTTDSFTGGFVIESPKSRDDHPEYGPYQIQPGQTLVMQSSTGGFRPTYAEHIADSAMCGTCHTLITTARGEGGKPVGTFPEQVPYQEWLHSDYAGKQSCQSCHMPEVQGPSPISVVMSVDRLGVRQHSFSGGNFLLQRMLNSYRDELGVAALPEELTGAAETTSQFLQAGSARVTIPSLTAEGGTLRFEVAVENLTGHKMPTAYPSRRAWLHVIVRDRNGRAVFESGALNPDGSIVGNDNDADPMRFEPHYRRITRPDQVQIYEPILGDSAGHVTTGLLRAVTYLKDNRLLPHGFNKQTAEKDIAVWGDAASDPKFTGGGDRLEYAIALDNAEGPLQVQVELWYQPIGFRWAHNLEPYKAAEPQRFVGYYNAMSSATAIMLAHAEATQ